MKIEIDEAQTKPYWVGDQLQVGFQQKCVIIIIIIIISLVYCFFFN